MATTEIYTLSLHDALPICTPPPAQQQLGARQVGRIGKQIGPEGVIVVEQASYAPVRLLRCRAMPFRKERSEEHTSELQSQSNLVCRLLLEKKKKNQYMI